MFNSQVLETAIGLVFVYLLLCLLCSGIKEAVARVLAWRSKTLEDALTNLIENPELIDEIFKNPLIRELKMEKWYHKILNFLPVFKKRGNPTSISADSFNMVLFEFLLKRAKTKSRQELENVIDALPESDLKKALLTLLSSIDSKVTKLEDVLTKLKEGASKWFDDKMEQLSAWYKRKAKVCIFIVAAFVVSFLNIDTFMIANSLYHDSTMRTLVVGAAEKLAESGDATSEDYTKKYTGKVEDMISKFYGDVQLAGLPIGWASKEKPKKEEASEDKSDDESKKEGASDDPPKNEEELDDEAKKKKCLEARKKDPTRFPCGPRDWLLKILGLLITALAVTLGAPFWYQKLRSLLQMRGGKTSAPAPAPAPAPKK